MRKYSSFHQSPHFVFGVILICVMALATYAWSLDAYPSRETNASSALQEHDRKVSKLVFPKEPVKVAAVKVLKGEIKVDKDFLGDDDWLRGFTVTVDNTSGKTITSLTIDILFVRPKNDETSEDPPLAYPLHFGPSISSPQDYARRDPSKVIKPGDTINLALSDENYDFLKGALKGLKYPDSIKRVELRLTEVGFDDGTSWQGGQLYQPDPSNPSRRIRMTRSVSRSPRKVSFLKASLPAIQQINEQGRCGYAGVQEWLWCAPGFPDGCQKRNFPVLSGEPMDVEVRPEAQACLRWDASRNVYVNCGPVEISGGTKPCSECPSPKERNQQGIVSVPVTFHNAPAGKPATVPHAPAKWALQFWLT